MYYIFRYIIIITPFHIKGEKGSIEGGIKKVSPFLEEQMQQIL